MVIVRFRQLRPFLIKQKCLPIASSQPYFFILALRGQRRFTLGNYDPILAITQFNPAVAQLRAVNPRPMMLLTVLPCARPNLPSVVLEVQPINVCEPGPET